MIPFFEQAPDEIKKIRANRLKDYTFPSLPKNPGPYNVHIGECISVESKNTSNEYTEELDGILKKQIPWKKGPFKIFDSHIDSEWKSDLKWNRLQFEDLKDKVICDIGCNNGYFMYRMLEHKPKAVIGIEPYLLNLSQFSILQNYIKAKNVFFEPCGVEHIHHFKGMFDTIFCLGILYHHTDPVGVLRNIFTALAKGGEVIIDCQCIDGEKDYALVPKRKYCGASGVWFVPTLSALTNWIKRAGFSQISVVYNEYLSDYEQRSTEWAPFESLKDFLDSDDPKMTKEGYPAPRRIYLRVKR